MLKIILWGTGKIADKLIGVIKDEIVLVVDNDKKKWGSVWNNYVVERPCSLKEYIGVFDKIIIAATSWEIIRRQIIENFKINEALIENMYYRQKNALLKYYGTTVRDDKKKYIDFLRTHPLGVFNDKFISKYEKVDQQVYFDFEKSFFYVYHNNKKMYFPSGFSTEDQVKRYYHSLLIEQDPDSPHRYQTKSFHVCQHDIVLDIGSAEGNFALDVIDVVDKLYLVEADKEWIKALKYTFEPYKDKVEIIEGTIGDGKQGELTIDAIISGKTIDFIKMDIEGAEQKALEGAIQTLEQNNVKLDICSYHNFDDEEKIKKMLMSIGYEAETSEGYMIFITNDFLKREVICPRFVRGLIRGRKHKIC